MQMYKNVNDCFWGLLSAFGKLKYVNVEFRVFFPLIFDKSALDSQLPKKNKTKNGDMATRTIRITISPFPRYATLPKSKQGGDGFYN